MKWYLLIATLILFSAGCTARITTDVTLLGKSAYLPKPANCELQLFSEAPADKAYEELAIIDAKTDGGSLSPKTLEAMLPSIRAKACELGADAIIIKNVELGGTPVGEYGSQTPGKAFCVAIRTAGSK